MVSAIFSDRPIFTFRAVGLLVQQDSSDSYMNCAFYGKSPTFCIVILYTTKVILRLRPILKVTGGDLGSHFECCPFVERIFRYCGCRAALYCMYYISLSLENYHSIMLNTLLVFQDGEKYKMAATCHILSYICAYSPDVKS